MKKFLTVALLAGMILPVMTPQAQALYRPNACRFQRLDAGTWTKRENKRTINCIARAEGVSVYMADLIASHESGYSRFAYNSYSCAEGLFQFLCSGWSYRVQAHTKALNQWEVHNRTWTSPRAQAVIAIMTAKAVGWYSNWCAWASYC